MRNEPLKVLISSSVYGTQSLLRQSYATLRGYGYNVICPPVGSLAVNPRKSNLENCLHAMTECDIFVGFIRPISGSGRDSTEEKSVTHLELERAIAVNRPRWMMVHSSVVKMRNLVGHVFYDKKGVRNGVEFKPLKGEFDDLRVIEMYELAADSRIASEKRRWRFRDPNDLRMALEDLNLLDNGRLTDAAVVLFAQEAGHIFPQAHVRLTACSWEKSGAEFQEDRVSRGHLFAHLKDYDAFLGRHVIVSSEFTAAKSHREDRPQYPYWSLREGFRNPLIHRNYEAVYGRVSVSVYPARLEIWSFGDLPHGLSVSALKTGDRSLPVNPDIAQVVFLRGLVDLFGRGTRKMVEKFKAQALPAPAWKKQAGGVCVTLRSRTTPGEPPKELNARQVGLRRRMKPGGQTDLTKYGKEIEGKLSERALRNDLSQLVQLGYMAKQGQEKNTFYVRTEKPAG